jgi:hypothetical protein
MYVWNASVELYMCFCNCMIYSTSYSHLTNFGSMECNVIYVCIYYGLQKIIIAENYGMCHSGSSEVSDILEDLCHKL